MKSDQRVFVSKYLRMRMAGELRDMIEGIPFVGLEETQAESHVYVGNGRIMSGSRTYPAIVRVWIKGGDVWASLKAFGAGASISERFRTAEERRKFVEKVLERFKK